MTAILLAAGVTIGVVVSAITNGLKATGKAMAKGLKEIAAKLGSAWADRPDRDLPFQNRRQGRRLPRRTHLAPDFSRCRFPL